MNLHLKRNISSKGKLLSISILSLYLDYKRLFQFFHYHLILATHIFCLLGRL